MPSDWRLMHPFIIIFFFFSYLSKGARRPSSLGSHQLNWIADFIIIIITACFTLKIVLLVGAQQVRDTKLHSDKL